MEGWHFVAYNAVPIVCVICATILALKQREGWGWLLVIALLTSVAPKAVDKLSSPSSQGEPNKPTTTQP